MEYDEVSDCCKLCTHLDSDTLSIDYGPWYYFCDLNIFLPTRKQSCKKGTYPEAAKFCGELLDAFIEHEIEELTTIKKKNKVWKKENS
jgi:hypothetical protein